MRKDTIVSEQQDSIQPASVQATPSSKGKLTLLNSLIILAIIYAVGELAAQFVSLKAPSSIPWLELGQWVLIFIWLIVGVRSPFMQWLKRERARTS
jgi:hypothetical protein